MIERSLNPRGRYTARPLLTLIALGVAISLRISAQQPEPSPSQITVDGIPITGIPDDWTHHHIVFSNPGTEEEAIANGTHDRWLKVVNDPRYIIQQLHRGQPAQGPAAADVARIEGAAAPRPAPAVAQSAQPPAPAPQQTSAALASARAITGPVPLSRDRNTLAINPADSGAATPDKRHRLHKDWSMDLGAGSQGLTTFPAKYSFSAAASCANDYVAFNSGSLGTTSQATIVAYKNIYSGCTGTVPTVAWKYNTAGDSHLSPVISLDGSQIAFVQYVCTSGCTGSSPVDVSSLVILKWASNSSLVTLSSTAASSYRACAAPCMTSFTFSGNGFSGFSAPFYDYSSDIIYVGDNSGKLHKFTGVFLGTPAEVTTSPWPATVGSSPLSQPVLDHVSGKIFIGNTGGYYYSVNASTAAITGTSAHLDFVYGLWDAPLVDSSAQMTYVFAGNDGQTNCQDPYSLVYGCSGVFQFATSFTNLATTETQVYLGYYPLFTGTFDNIYYNSSGSSPTGHLYVCGETDYNYVQTLNQLPITANVLGAQTASTYYIGDGYPCSAVTEFYNTASLTDYIFLSNEGAYEGCTENTGCVFGFNVTSGAVPSAPTAAGAEAGGTSAIVIDNASGSGGSQIYFTTLSNTGSCITSGGTGLCAVQTSQSAP